MGLRGPSTARDGPCHDGSVRERHPTPSTTSVRRRDVLKAGAIGAGVALLPARSSAAVPTG
jgi:hypothetical protein